MAMIRCMECGNQMSDSATKCPHCGAHKLKAVGASPIQKVSGVLAIIMGAAIWWTALGEGNSLMIGLGCGFACLGFLVLVAPSRRK